MPNLLAMSFDGDIGPSFELRFLQEGRKLPDGWGLGCYPGGGPTALVLKEPAPAEGSTGGAVLPAWNQPIPNRSSATTLGGIF